MVYATISTSVWVENKANVGLSMIWMATTALCALIAASHIIHEYRHKGMPGLRNTVLSGSDFELMVHDTAEEPPSPPALWAPSYCALAAQGVRLMAVSAMLCGEAALPTHQARRPSTPGLMLSLSSFLR